MIYALAGLFIFLAIFFWTRNSRNHYNQVAIGHGALAILAFFLIGQDVVSDGVEMASNGLLLFGLLSGILAINMLFSHFWKRKATFWPPVFVLLSSFVLLIFGTETFDYNGFPVVFSSIPVLLLPLFGASVVPIADVKEKVLGDFFKIDFKNRRGFSRSVYFLLFGMFILVAHFIASYLGVALFALGFGASLFYGKKSAALWNMFLALLAITVIGHFAKEAKITESSLLLGRVLAGIFISGFIALIINTLQRARKNEKLGTLLSWFLLLFLPSMLILAVTQNINFGGGDAYIGILVGFAISACFGINTRKNDTVLSIYIAIGILLLPLTINKEEEEMSKISVTKVEGKVVEDPFELDSKEIDLTGEYKISESNSQLTFELGPTGGRTKGAFKTIDGVFNFDKENSIQVQLPIKSITTFNSYRDESLMEETYFFEEKYPSVQFMSTSFLSTNTGYELKGDFTMMGKTKELVLEMKYLGIGKDSKNPVFIGRSSLNRVDFGMKSDPKEGNVVDFQFKVELVK
jgi:polyisoprenoid-binding protein YceI|tara:strand:- start:13451 stop:15010 length:1560 start_codon:yes stop_codon:yes gene_type:complete